MSSKSLFIFTVLIYAKHNLASELCRSDDGYMTILNRTKIFSNLIKEHGNNTILVDQGSEFNFTCHDNKSGKSAQILFGSEDSSNHLKNNSSVSRVLKNSSLTKNFVGTNSDPISINCEGVCQIEFIVLFNAGSFCEDNSTHSMARANLNKSVWLVHQSTYLGVSESASIEIPPFKPFL